MGASGLGTVYSGRDNSGAAAVLPVGQAGPTHERTMHILAQYMENASARRAARSERKEIRDEKKQYDTKKNYEDEDISVEGVMEVDIKDISNNIKEYRGMGIDIGKEHGIAGYDVVNNPKGVRAMHNKKVDVLAMIERGKQHNKLWQQDAKRLGSDAGKTYNYDESQKKIALFMSLPQKERTEMLKDGSLLVPKKEYANPKAIAYKDKLGAELKLITEDNKSAWANSDGSVTTQAISTRSKDDIKGALYGHYLSAKRNPASYQAIEDQRMEHAISTGSNDYNVDSDDIDEYNGDPSFKFYAKEIMNLDGLVSKTVQNSMTKASSGKDDFEDVVITQDDRSGRSIYSKATGGEGGEQMPSGNNPMIDLAGISAQNKGVKTPNRSVSNNTYNRETGKKIESSTARPTIMERVEAVPVADKDFSIDIGGTPAKNPEKKPGQKYTPRKVHPKGTKLVYKKGDFIREEHRLAASKALDKNGNTQFTVTPTLFFKQQMPATEDDKAYDIPMYAPMSDYPAEVKALIGKKKWDEFNKISEEINYAEEDEFKDMFELDENGEINP